MRLTTEFSQARIGLLAAALSAAALLFSCQQTGKGPQADAAAAVDTTAPLTGTVTAELTDEETAWLDADAG